MKLRALLKWVFLNKRSHFERVAQEVCSETFYKGKGKLKVLMKS